MTTYKEYDELIKYYILNDETVKFLLPSCTKVSRYILKKENLDTSIDNFRKKVDRVLESMDLELIR